MELTSEQLEEIEKAYYSGEKTQAAIQKEYGIKEPIYKILPREKSESLCPYCGVPMDIIKVSKLDYKYRNGRHIEECPECGHSYDNCGYRNFKIDKESYWSVDNRTFCTNYIKKITACIAEKYGVQNFEEMMKDIDELSPQDKLLLLCFVEASTAKNVKAGETVYVQCECLDRDMDAIKEYLVERKLICVSWLDVYSYFACRIDNSSFDVKPSSYVSHLLWVKNLRNYNASFPVIDLCSSTIRKFVFDEFARCLEECFIVWIIERNERWSSFDFDECRFAEKIKMYFMKYSFGRIAGALHSMVSDFQYFERTSFNNHFDECRGLSSWFSKSLQKVLRGKDKDVFYLDEKQCSTFIRFVINNVDFGCQSFFDIVWGDIGKRVVRVNKKGNADTEILERFDRIEKLLLELKGDK